MKSPVHRCGKCGKPLRTIYMPSGEKKEVCVWCEAAKAERVHTVVCKWPNGR